MKIKHALNAKPNINGDTIIQLIGLPFRFALCLIISPAILIFGGFLVIFGGVSMWEIKDFFKDVGGFIMNGFD
jgi:hypothetical protein